MLMMHRRTWITLAVVATVLTSCLQREFLYPVEPVITNVQVSVVEISSVRYEVTFRLDYTDGDGDLGILDTSDLTSALVFEETRPNVDEFFFGSCFSSDTTVIPAGTPIRFCVIGTPRIEEADSVFARDTVLDPSRNFIAERVLPISSQSFDNLSNDFRIPSIDGTLQFSYTTERVRDTVSFTVPNSQQVTYTIYLRDRAGNESNREVRTITLN